MLLAGLAQPVGGLTGAVHVLGNESLVQAVAAGLHPAELGCGDVLDGTVLKRAGQLGVDGASAGTTARRLVHLFNADDLGASLGGSTGGRGASKACADDEDVAVEGGDNLIGGHGLGGGHE